MSSRHPLESILRALETVLPQRRISRARQDILGYARDQWPRSLIALREGNIEIAPPDLVVWPETTKEVAEIIRVAVEHKFPIVPWGAGSGVCGAAMAIKGGMVMDLKRMNRVLQVSATDSLASFETGILGQHLEDELNLRGMTLGHFPSSIHCSTLGGWLATRSAGQASSRYGKIEDMVQAIKVVTGDGRTHTFERGEDPDFIQLIVGSEGTLGIITEATMRIWPLPEARTFRAYRFPRLAAGCEGMRRLMQRGLRPSILRLYDELDTLIANTHPSEGRTGLLSAALDLVPRPEAPQQRTSLRQRATRLLLGRAKLVNRLGKHVIPSLGGGCLMILGLEGDVAQLSADLAICHAELEAAGGQDQGEEAGMRWYRQRYSVSHKQSPLFISGGFVDTMEVATSWSNLLPLYRSVKAAFDDNAVVMAHFSHAYPEGCSIYFTFAAAARQRGKSQHLYDEIWRRGLGAVVRAGGTISHHHGIGISKAGFVEDELGSALDVLQQVKEVLDPNGILNPGKLGL